MNLSHNSIDRDFLKIIFFVNTIEVTSKNHELVT